MSNKNYDDAINEIKYDVIQNYLLEDMSPIEVYESLVNEVDLSLFDYNKAVFLKFVESVTFDALVTSNVIQKNNDLFKDFYEY